MGCGIEGHAVFIAPNDVTALLFPLLGRVMMLFAQRLPVGLVPEELLSLCYLILSAAVDSFLQPVWLDVVNDCGGYRSPLPMAHDAKRMRLKE